MKREKFLFPLTAGHQEALLACREIREYAQSIRGDGSMDVWSGLTEGSRDYFKNRLEPHFRAEEAMMPLLVRHLGPGHPSVEKALADHRFLRGLARKGSLDSLLLLAEGLEAHIHFEESTLYPLLQEELTAAEKNEASRTLEKTLPSSPDGSLTNGGNIP